MQEIRSERHVAMKLPLAPSHASAPRILWISAHLFGDLAGCCIDQLYVYLGLSAPFVSSPQTRY